MTFFFCSVAFVISYCCLTRLMIYVNNQRIWGYINSTMAYRVHYLTCQILYELNCL